MALLHRATLTPTKLDLLQQWLPTRPWAGTVGSLQQVGSFRFDDPDGEVGMETLLVTPGDGVVLQVPLTYRAEALSGAALVGTMEHSVLGHRWVYDACTDPAWVAVAVATACGGGTGAEEVVDTGEGRVPRTPTATVRGTGSGSAPAAALVGVREHAPDTVVVTDLGELRLHRVLAGASVEAPVRLLGAWDDGPGEVELAVWSAR
ncbi:MAG: hypothetical protein U0Q15_15760 [Kineosporiaceae bacterium]